MGNRNGESWLPIDPGNWGRATMTMRWSYIGELGDGHALDWGGGDYDNTPTGGQFLPDWEDTKLYLKIRQHARNGNYSGKQLDWGSFAIKVNGPELLVVLEDCYGDLGSAPPDSLLASYANFARSLGPDKSVALVSCEL